MFRSRFQNFDLQVLFIDFNCRLHVQVSCPIFHQAVTHTRERCLLCSRHLPVEVETMFRVLRSHYRSISRLKLRRYLSTRFATVPPKLEVNFKVTHVLWSDSGAKETTPAAKWSGAWWSARVRHASLRSGTRSIISRVVSYCFPLKPSEAIKW